MTKQLTPLRRKDQATGYQAAVREIVAYARGHGGNAWSRDVLYFADQIEAKFGGRDDQ